MRLKKTSPPWLKIPMKYSAPPAIAPHTPSGSATVSALANKFINPPLDRDTVILDRASRYASGIAGR